MAVRPLRDVEDESDGCADDEPAAHASDEAIQVFLHEAGGSDVLDHSARLKDDHLRGKRLKIPNAVFVVSADVVDAGRKRSRGRGGIGSGRCSGVGCGAWSFGDDGRDDFVADAGLLERDQAIGRGVVGARGGIDGGDDDVVCEPSLDHFDDGVVIQRLLSNEEWAKHQEQKRTNGLAHRSLSLTSGIGKRVAGIQENDPLRRVVFARGLLG